MTDTALDLVVESGLLYVRRRPRNGGHKRLHIVQYTGAHIGRGLTLCGLDYKLGDGWVEDHDTRGGKLCKHCKGISARGYKVTLNETKHGDVKWEDDEPSVYCAACRTWFPVIDLEPEDLLREHVDELHD